jgi:hypothetical protein
MKYRVIFMFVDPGKTFSLKTNCHQSEYSRVSEMLPSCMLAPPQLILLFTVA